MISTNATGAVTESAIVLAATKLGIGVSKPLFDARRYDLIFDLGQRLLRVQCKTAVRRGDVLAVQCHSSRRTRDGFAKRPYSADEIDAIAAYAAEFDRCYLLPADVFAGRAYVQLRLAPARNNQVSGTHWAPGFELESLDLIGVGGP